MTTISPMYIDNEIISDDIVIDICDNYICEICYDNYGNLEEYKCDNEKCNKYMCNTCFAKWGETPNHNTCVFCTVPLEVSYVAPNPSDLDLSIREDYNNERKEICCILKISLIGGSSYLIGLIYTGKPSDKYIFLNVMLGLLTFLFIFGLRSTCCKVRN